MKRFLLGLVLIIVAFLPSAAMVGAEMRTFNSSAVRRASFTRARDGVSVAEQISFDPALASFLSEVSMEEAIRLPQWPIAPGVRSDVVLTRHDVYAADAHLLRAEGEALTEVPRSGFHFFWGTAEADETIRVLLTFDPEEKSLAGLAQTPLGLQELRSGPRGGFGSQTLAAAEAFLTREEKRSRWACGDDEMPGLERSRSSSPNSALSGIAPLAITSLHTATLAVDTDNELMSLKFSDNTTSATNYIASLFAAMNVMYERDLLVRLLIGTTFLRVSTTADPYFATGGNAGGAQLTEFSNYWNANYGTVQRALAVMLSGKQSSSNSASGIAWVDGLCSTSSGYSFSQVFKVDYLAGDASVVGHEIGHNVGSRHTHCDGIDACYNLESCYSGATSCPAPATYSGIPNVTGTVMSYCHRLSGCSSTLVFHPQTISLLAPKVQAAVGSCIFPFSVPPVGPMKFYTLPPCRIIDTRNATGPLGGPALVAGGRRLFLVAGVSGAAGCGVPLAAKALSANVTVTQPAASGDLRIFGGNLAVPSGTSINFTPGQTRANSAQAGLATDGTGTIAVQNDAAGTVQLLMDVNGYYK